jgi:TRAP-type C4-dicarboxylate transport system permease small subunit
MKHRSSFRLAAASAAVFSQSAFAHPGHDHSFWASNAVHSLTFLSLIMLGAAATYALQKHLARKKITSQDDQ